MNPLRMFWSWLLKISVFRIAMLASFIFLVMFVLKTEYGVSVSFLDQMEFKMLDLKFRWRGTSPHSDKVFVAAVDEKSIQALGRWPWNRAYVAALIQKLAQSGTAVTAFDVIFGDEIEKPSMYYQDVLEHLDEMDLSGCGNSCEESCENALDLLADWLNEAKKQNDPDAILAEAIGHIDNVILGFFIFNSAVEVSHLDPKVRQEGLERIEPGKVVLTNSLMSDEERKRFPVRYSKGLAVRAPLKVFTDQTDYYGHFSFRQDEDGVIRWADLVTEVENVLRPDDPEDRLIFPSLSLKSAALLLDKEVVITTYPKGVESINLGMDADAVRIPTNDRGRLLINFQGPAHTFPHYSAIDILKGKIPKEKLEGRVALIGATATGVYDLRVTPYDENFPGVEIHANIIDNILNQDFISRPFWAGMVEVIVILFIGVIFGYSLTRLDALWGATLAVVMIIGYYMLDRLFFFANGYWISTILPLTQILVTFILCYMYRYMVEEKEKRATRRAFSQYLNPEVVDSIMSDYDNLKLGGQEREMTVMFSDVRGFTTLSETLSPADLGEVMNLYFTPATDILIQNRGTLDKYIGDAMMAFWGAPQDQPDHAILACRAGLQMIANLTLIRQTLKERYPDNTVLHKFDVGLGVNSGLMWVGNMGSDKRFNYTMLGDGVNLGSRLEGTNKVYGTRSIISEYTHELVKGHFLCRRMDLIRVKGKTKPVGIYELIADGKGTPEQQEIVRRFEEGFEAYLARNFQQALTLFQALAEEYPGDGPTALFVTRSRQYLETPPDESWDGSFTMTTK